MIGYRSSVLKFLNPEITAYYRFSSEANGLSNGNIHTRAILKHEFFKEEFFRVIPILEAGYQTPNNSIDKPNGISDITARLQFFFGYFLIGLNGTHRPNLYLYDNDRNYPRIGGHNDVNPNDGKTVDPSKTAGIANRLVLDTIHQSNTHEAGKAICHSQLPGATYCKKYFYLAYWLFSKILIRIGRSLLAPIYIADLWRVSLRGQSLSDYNF